MPAVQPEIANDPRQVLFLDDVIGIRRPEALGIKLLECLAREFESALADIFVCRIHRNHLTQSQPRLKLPLPHRYQFPMQDNEPPISIPHYAASTVAESFPFQPTSPLMLMRYICRPSLCGESMHTHFPSRLARG